jgi:hypothetical protein
VILDTFLGRALTDPETGLPNIPYFCLIQNWEQRRARRRRTLVRVVRLHVERGQELRTSDLIASEGKSEFRVLLTSPDAECVESVVERIGELTTTLNEGDAFREEDQLSLAIEVEPWADEGDPADGPCIPCNKQAMGTESEHELRSL